ncbi:MAG: 3-deoxy-7-phosphoheptulonate synthase [Opitutaceae bacterium]|jgi:3-deoxy-7-phosphoheptulonate synthase|nr:3-deoxy-7-phosphoheptulonate synthase [Opitutaceae bacterium]
MPETADLRIRATKPLIAPGLLAEEIPLPDASRDQIAEARHEIAAIMRGEDDRLLVVAGPCSIHDPAAALDYADLLAPAAEKYRQDLLIVMRVYFEKPRTVVGWKGLINDPTRDGSYQINQGLRLGRQLLIDVTAKGLPIATEFLDTTLGQFYADVISWGAIGARTVESQVHRELASGLSMPVGFKNRTDGNLKVAVDAIRSANNPHWFPTLTREGAPAIMGTSGNPDTHMVLRGGSAGPNYSATHIAEAKTQLEAQKLPAYVMVDCSHANSGKDAEKQPEVAGDLANQIAQGEPAIAALMLESHLVGGNQSLDTKPLVYGRSITDACLAWEKTLPVLDHLAQAVRSRRNSG